MIDCIVKMYNIRGGYYWKEFDRVFTIETARKKLDFFRKKAKEEHERITVKEILDE